MDGGTGKFLGVLIVATCMKMFLTLFHVQENVLFGNNSQKVTEKNEN